MSIETAEPESVRVLDEIRDWFTDHVVAGESAITAMILFAAASWAGGVAGPFVTLPRMIILGKAESGKTTGMNTTASLGPNPTDADGTYADLQSALAEAANTPENPLRIFYFDEIGEVYGDDGQNKGANKTLNKLLRKGYKRGATDGRSRNGMSRRFSIFFPVIMTGRDVSIPVDVRGRTIVVRMESGEPRRYFDARESEPEAFDYGQSLRHAVQEHTEELRAFRARGYHPKLTKRKLEVWEPLFAVAKVLGGQKWLKLCLSAFLELALASEQVAMTPRQRVVRDLTDILGKAAFELPNGKMFAGAETLAEQMRDLDPERYGDRSMTQLIARTMDPVESRQIRIGDKRIRGYYASDILTLWEEIAPEELKDVKDPDDDDPLKITDTDDEVFEVPVTDPKDPVTDPGRSERSVTASQGHSEKLPTTRHTKAKLPDAEKKFLIEGKTA